MVSLIVDHTKENLHIPTQTKIESAARKAHGTHVISSINRDENFHPYPTYSSKFESIVFLDKKFENSTDLPRKLSRGHAQRQTCLILQPISRDWRAMADGI